MLGKINWDLVIVGLAALGSIGLMVAIGCGIVWCFRALTEMHDRNHDRMIEFIDKHVELEKAKHQQG